MLSVANSRDRGILDIERRRKVRLANTKGKYVATLTDQAVDFRQHDECVLGAQALAPPTDSRQRLERVPWRVHWRPPAS